MSTDGGSVWTQIDSWLGEGGSCIVHPDDDNVVLYAGQGTSSTSNFSFGVCRSTNGGSSWTRSFIDQSARGYCYALAVARSDPDRVYSAGYINGTGAVGVSTDRGLTWARTATAPAETVFGLAVDPRDALRAFAASAGGVYRTTDGGASWDCVHRRAGMRAVALFPGSEDTVIAAGDDGVFASFDNGTNWEDMSTGLDRHPVHCLEFTSEDAVRLYAGTADAAAFRYSFLTGIATPPRPGSVRTRLSVRPSVTRKTVWLSLPVREGRVGVRLVDASGRVRRSLEVCGSAELDLGGLATGVYQVVPEPASDLASARFVLRR